MKDYQFTALVLLKFEFRRYSNDPEATQEQMLERYTEFAEKLVKEYEISGCIGHGVEVSAPVEVT